MLNLWPPLNCLCSCSVIYRDIKPDNIGFDVRGTVKVFDLGLAKEIHPPGGISGLYNLTGETGSPRYMSPEGKSFLNGFRKVDSLVASLSGIEQAL